MGRRVHLTPQQRWNRAHPEKLREAARRHRKKYPERVVRQNQRRSPYKRDWIRLRRYGMTRGEFERMLGRQGNRCAGCGTKVEIGTAHVDHCHASGRVRGLLCGRCNSALGFAKESPAVLYQLAAYLELPRQRPVVYVIGSLRNPDGVITLGNELRSRGFEVVDNWIAAGELADDSWQAYSQALGKTYAQALESRESRHVFHFDRAYIHLADAVVLLYPAGKSAHLELGYAVGLGKKSYVLTEQAPERYDVMLQFANASVFENKEKFLDRIRSDFPTEM